MTFRSARSPPPGGRAIGGFASPFLVAVPSARPTAIFANAWCRRIQQLVSVSRSREFQVARKYRLHEFAIHVALSRLMEKSLSAIQ